MRIHAVLLGVMASVAVLGPTDFSHAADTSIVLVAGAPSHPPGQHEHRAGMLLLGRCLNAVPGVKTTVVSGWPDDAVLDAANAVVLYSDGGPKHPAIQGDRLAKLEKRMRQGVGLGCLHYAVLTPKERGGTEFLRWIGGYYETHWSVNPFWTAQFKTFPDHPITRGVQPFDLYDEWYYHMRFVDDLKGVTPLLSAHPPAETLSRPDGPHSGNPAVREAIRKGEIQHLMWAYQRPDGGRGFGLTGSHAHTEWGNDNFRKLVLNAILWIARVEVPPQGVASSVSDDELKRNLDPK